MPSVNANRPARSMWSCLAKTSIMCNHLAILPLHCYDVERTANSIKKKWEAEILEPYTKLENFGGWPPDIQI